MPLLFWRKSQERKKLRRKQREQRIDYQRVEIDNLRCSQDFKSDLVDRYYRERVTPDYKSVFSEPEPLVTICVATYNRAELIGSRSLPSLINQSYKNIEIIVIGDCCTDDTENVVRNLADERIRFVNLPERGCYPDEPQHRWMVAGTTPMNHALRMAKGSFITHLDDDDQHDPKRIELLVNLALEKKAEVIWHPFDFETSTGQWSRQDAENFEAAKVTTSSIFYHRWFRQIEWDIEAWRMKEPGDWNRLRKFRYLNPSFARHSQSLLKHFRERAQGQKK